MIAEKNSKSRCFNVQWNKTSEDTFFSKGTSARSFVAASDEHLHMYQVDDLPLTHVETPSACNSITVHVAEYTFEAGPLRSSTVPTRCRL